MYNSAKTPTEFVVFDMDGVLVDTVSSWVWVHQHFGVNNDASHEKYMREEIDDEEFMRSDIALWLKIKPRINIDEIRGILDNVPIMPGFETIMNTLTHLGIGVAIVSSGLEPLANRVGRIGRIPNILANGLKTDEEGYLTGEGILKVELRSKGQPVEQLISSLGYSKEATVAVGNGATDIPMFKACGMGIAFNPIDTRPVEDADYVIYNKDLTEILKHICDIDSLIV
jgi:phosphoserine phosphatase